MLEYLNYGGLSLLLFITVVTFMIDKKSDKKEVSTGSYILLSFLIGLLLLDASDKATTTTESIDSFKNKNIALKCTVGGGLYTSAREYRILKSDGWSLEKGQFMKDSLLINPSRCERW